MQNTTRPEEVTIEDLGLLDELPGASGTPPMNGTGVGVDFDNVKITTVRGNIQFHEVFELEADDLLLMQQKDLSIKRGRKQGPSALELKAKHHELARLLVLGYKAKDIKRALGYTSTTISNLKKTPAFKALFDHYMGIRNEILTDPQTRMGADAMANLDIMQDRINADPLGIPFNQLSKHTMDLLDRTGNAPISRTEARHEMIFLGKDEIEQVKAEAIAKPIGAITDATGDETRVDSAIEADFEEVSERSDLLGESGKSSSLLDEPQAGENEPSSSPRAEVRAEGSKGAGSKVRAA